MKGDLIMPLPTPREKETKEDFIKRSMGDPVMLREYPDQSQRYAITLNLWKEKSRKKFEHWE